MSGISARWREKSQLNCLTRIAFCFVLAVSTLAAASCAPQMRQLYPPSATDDVTSIDEVIDGLSARSRIQIRVAGGDYSMLSNMHDSGP